MSSFTEKMRQKDDLRRSFYQLVINPSETYQKSDVYIYCSNIITQNGIEYFPLIARNKKATWNEYLNPDNYMIPHGSSEKELKKEAARTVAASDDTHGIFCVAINKQTFNRINGECENLTREMIGLVQREVQEQNLAKDREKEALFDHCFAQINYMHDPDLSGELLLTSEGPAERKGLLSRWLDKDDYTDEGRYDADKAAAEAEYDGTGGADIDNDGIDDSIDISFDP